ncbi:MAG: 4-hydroxy-tetrahydrodipicolinate reductase [Actinomycetota bacterium]
MIRAGVLGATGAMGRTACAAILADDGLDLVAAVSRSAAGQPVADVPGTGGTDLVYTGSLASVQDAGAEVLVDFTSASFAPEHIAWGIEHGVHVVEGTTGFEVDEAWRRAPVGIVIAPNFAIGAVLMMRFAEQAARFFDAAEIVELHHDRKADAPGGTAIATAGRIAAARQGDWAPPGGDGAHPGARGADIEGVRVHAVRLPGLLAHQEVILGGDGQTLTIRHDTTDRAAFMPGLLLAIRWAPEHPGLTVGLDSILD